jgi:hypothetical protein
MRPARHLAHVLNQRTHRHTSSINDPNRQLWRRFRAPASSGGFPCPPGPWSAHGASRRRQRQRLREAGGIIFDPLAEHHTTVATHHNDAVMVSGLVRFGNTSRVIASLIGALRFRWTHAAP